MVSTPVPPMPATRMLQPLSSSAAIRGSGRLAISCPSRTGSALERTAILAPDTVTNDGQKPFTQL